MRRSAIREQPLGLLGVPRQAHRLESGGGIFEEVTVPSSDAERPGCERADRQKRARSGFSPPHVGQFSATEGILDRLYTRVMRLERGLGPGPDDGAPPQPGRDTPSWRMSSPGS